MIIIIEYFPAETARAEETGNASEKSARNRELSLPCREHVFGSLPFSRPARRSRFRVAAPPHPSATPQQPPRRTRDVFFFYSFIYLLLLLLFFSNIIFRPENKGYPVSEVPATPERSSSQRGSSPRKTLSFGFRAIEPILLCSAQHRCNVLRPHPPFPTPFASCALRLFNNPWVDERESK